MKMGKKRATGDIVERETLKSSGTKFGFYSWYNGKLFKVFKQG